ncbi:Phospholipase D [Psidium guajava]|nr:Phospholipase D [Psidium guajava]
MLDPSLDDSKPCKWGSASPEKRAERNVPSVSSNGGICIGSPRANMEKPLHEEEEKDVYEKDGRRTSKTTL